MRPHIAELSRIADTLVCAYPNAGLPNALGEYDETAGRDRPQLHDWAEQGIVNILGGCCGTTPDHISTSPRRCRAEPRAVPSGRRPCGWRGWSRSSLQ